MIKNPFTLKTQRAIEKYGADTCMHAFERNRKDGEGPAMIGYNLGLSVMQANAAINAGEEIEAWRQKVCSKV